MKLDDKLVVQEPRPILSIVIPTFNRCSLLKELLGDIEKLLSLTNDPVQIVISDNSSKDGTQSLTEEFERKWSDRVLLIQRKTNIGMEGNIANSMLAAGGRYTWLLSDHQRIIPNTVVEIIIFLKTVEFDVGYMKIAQWDLVLTQPWNLQIWSEITEQQKGSFFYNAGNISGLIYRTDLTISAAGSIFRCCGYNYPHLGIISAMSNKSRVIEFPDTSIPPQGVQLKLAVAEYNKTTACFVNHILCLENMFSVAKIDFSRQWFASRGYKMAFVSHLTDILSYYEGGVVQICRKLTHVVIANRGFVRVFALAGIASLLMVPPKIRRRLFTRLKLKWKARKQQEHGRL